MNAQKFRQLSVSRGLETIEAIDQLARLLTLEAEGKPVPKYKAVHIAITEAIERRTTNHQPKEQPPCPTKSESNRTERIGKR